MPDRIDAMLDRIGMVRRLLTAADSDVDEDIVKGDSGGIELMNSARYSVSGTAIATFGLTLLAAAPVSAQLNIPVAACTAMDRSRLIEWDVEIDPQTNAGAADTIAGALVVDRLSSKRSRVLFVTRTGDSARLYRLTPGLNMKKDAAEARSWDLASFFTGGIRLRPSGDGRFVYVNTLLQPDFEGGVVAIDSKDNTRTRWPDRPFNLQMSDITVETRGAPISVFTAAPEYNPVPGSAPLTGGVVQRLRPGTPSTTKNADGTTNVPAAVTRWQVGGGAGTCNEGAGSQTAPCIPGVAVDRQGKVFVSEPDYMFANGRVGAIGELDPTLVTCPATVPAAKCSLVRHWPTPPMTNGPRQILVDNDGVVWGITTTGEVFSLRIDRSTNKAWQTLHNPIPGHGTEYMFAVAPDGGTIGFTDSNGDKVSLLFPKKNAKLVTAEPKYVPAESGTITGIRENVYPATHPVTPTVAKANTLIYTTTADDGLYRETDISSGQTQNMTPTGSTRPTGMTPDIARRTGSFYYGVGIVAGELISHRIGQLLTPIEPEKELQERRDDDDFDHDGVDNDQDGDDDDDGKADNMDDDDDNDCIKDADDHDKDNDGIEDDEDTKDRETKKKDSGSMSPGQAITYEMEADANSLALLAIVEAANVAVPFVLDIIDPAGAVVLSVPSVAGKAVATATPSLPGFYTIQLRNTGATSTTYSTTIIGRSIWF
jgi:hypothetical protein